MKQQKNIVSTTETATKPSSQSDTQHDVIAVKHLGTRGPYAKVFVDGIYTVTARFSAGFLDLKGRYPATAFLQIVDVATRVL